MTTPEAVLLDVGGIFHLPAHDNIVAAFDRGGFAVDSSRLDRAHYCGAARFEVDYEGELPWKEFWAAYLESYCDACGVPAGSRPEALEHLESEFAVAALWSRVIPGSVEGLRALETTGVRLGIVSNADGAVAARLHEQEVLQVGPGLGVPVECVIDSGEVGVQKPDPRIFRIALEALDLPPERVWYVGDMPGIDVVGARAAGLRPLLMDPFGLHDTAGSNGFETVRSLHDVAKLV